MESVLWTGSFLQVVVICEKGCKEYGLVACCMFRYALFMGMTVGMVSTISEALQNKKPAIACGVKVWDGGRARARTVDPLIKSQLLYQLSYAPKELW